MPRKTSDAPSRGTSRKAPQNSAACGFALALIRIFLGFQFVLAAYSKWDWIGRTRLSEQLTDWGNHAAWPVYGQYLLNIIVPHASLFTYLLVLGELVMGVLLLFGLLTRLVALPALTLNTCILLATWHIGGSVRIVNESFLVMELGIIITGAGRFLGLDAQLAQKHPGWILW